jgi:hypothetical protein
MSKGSLKHIKITPTGRDLLIDRGINYVRGLCDGAGVAEFSELPAAVIERINREGAEWAAEAA